MTEYLYFPPKNAHIISLCPCVVVVCSLWTKALIGAIYYFYQGLSAQQSSGGCLSGFYILFVCCLAGFSHVSLSLKETCTAPHHTLKESEGHRYALHCLLSSPWLPSTGSIKEEWKGKIHRRILLGAGARTKRIVFGDFLLKQQTHTCTHTNNIRDQIQRRRRKITSKWPAT